MAEQRGYRKQHPDGEQEEFYESMPATMEPPRYRDDPVIIERDRESGGSGWAIAALIIVGIILLLLIVGRLGSVNLSGGSGSNVTVPNTGNQ